MIGQNLMRYALAVPALIALSPAAHAATAECLIQVEGKTYIKGPCSVYREENGSLSVGTDGERITSPYFALINANPDGSVSGYWSKVPGSTHAQTPLGKMRRSGSCWENPIAKVCAGE